MVLAAEPERWPRRLVRAGWRAAVVGAAAGGLAWIVDGAPTAQGVALGLGGTTFTLDLAERAARLRSSEPRRVLQVAAAVWAASGCLVVASVTHAAFAAAREQGQPLDVAWDATSREVGAFASDLGAWLRVALVTSWVPTTFFVRFPGKSIDPDVFLMLLLGLSAAAALGSGVEFKAVILVAGPVWLLVVATALVAAGLLYVLDLLEARFAPAPPPVRDRPG